MKPLLLITSLLLSLAQPVAAQNEKITYPIVISFQSQCCGVPSDTVVRNFIAAFKKKYKVKRITAYHIGPMGREGEYYLAFKLNELSKKKAGYFVTKIKKIRPLKSDRGTLSVKEQFEIDPDLISGRAGTKAVVF
ncbi:MAG: hypothetical protein ABI741_11940 [Ferruginibacter sp.]